MVTATPCGETATSVRETAGDSASSLYEQDFYAWTLHNADLLRQGRLAEIDLANVAEELESRGGRERRELVSRLTELLLHLLKWRFQPKRRSGSWRTSISHQRIGIEFLLSDSPSLRPLLVERFELAYRHARRYAAAETRLPLATFPTACPFTLEQVLDAGFWPDSMSNDDGYLHAD